MKIRILFFLGCVLSQIHVYSQGNLQFNTVYNFQGNTSTATPVNGINYQSGYGISGLTVPANKIWRIERVYINGPQAPTLYVNNYVADFPASGTVLENTNPIWLKAGDVIKLGSANGAAWYHLNIVEFNIIP